MSWSGGKDSSLALNEILHEKGVKVVGLLTTITQDYDRISMHGVRRSLLRWQATSAGLPLYEVPISKNATNELYEHAMESSLSQLKERQEISAIVFGDLFLRDIREYREKLLSRLDMKCLFPLWGRDTGELAKFFVDVGFRAIVCTIDPRKMDASFCGREFDCSFLSEIPKDVDPCGENGEFHTFVYDGPIFKSPITITKGEIVERDGFYFTDLLPLKEGEGSSESSLLRKSA